MNNHLDTKLSLLCKLSLCDTLRQSFLDSGTCVFHTDKLPPRALPLKRSNVFQVAEHVHLFLCLSNKVVQLETYLQLIRQGPSTALICGNNCLATAADAFSANIEISTPRFDSDK